jgi:ectoine hydroxylase-related dioxygenase (phytanoyl-CoA dioxygenase family)
MLTFRIHLDSMDDQNGPLSVIPGSHCIDDENSNAPPTVIHAAAGDVMAMRPLLVHASSASQPGSERHRRIIHLELASSSELPDGYEWERYWRL